MGCTACLAKGTVCGTGDCDGHAHGAEPVLAVIEAFATKRRPALNPFAAVPAFSRGAGFVGRGAGLDSTGSSSGDSGGVGIKTPTTAGGQPDYAAIAGAIAATGTAIANVVNASNNNSFHPSDTSQTSSSLTASPPPTPPATAPLGIPVPYWIGAAGVVGAAWWFMKGKRRRR